MDPKNYKLFALKKLIMDNPIDEQPVEEINASIAMLTKMYGIHENTYRLLVDLLQLSLKARLSLEQVKVEGSLLDINIAHKYKIKIKDEASDLYHRIQDKQLDIVQKKLNAYMK